MFNLEMRKISLDNWKLDLYYMLNEIDGDLTGINGEDYLFKEAKEKGYESNLDYYFDKFEVKELCDLDKVLDFLKEEYFMGVASDYFTHFDMQYMYEKDKDGVSTGNVFLSIAYSSH